MPLLVPALSLAGGFHRDVVQPLMGRQPHASALLGRGSDVLDLDAA